MLRKRPGTALSKAAYIMIAVIALAAVVFGGLYGPTGSVAKAQSAPAYFSLNNVVATTTMVNLRDQPAASGSVVASMPVNSKAQVIGGPFNDGWYWLDYNGTRAYASGKYLVIVDDNWKPVSTETPTQVASPTVTPGTSATSTVTGTVSAPSPVTTVTGGSPTATPTDVVTAPATPGDYTGLWLAELAVGGNVRTGPGLDNPVMKSWWPGRRVLLYQAVTDSKGGVWYRVSDPPEAPMWVHSSLIRKVAPVQFEPARFKGRWVNVNLAQQVVTAYQDGTPVKVTLASTGKGKNETTPGVWKIYWRLTSQEMKGGNLASGDYYDLPNVQWVQYFQMSGEALHGTYWHDDFGHPHSHGCVNLSNPIAQWFYGWANIGTTVYVH